MPTSWTKVNKASGTSWTKIAKATGGGASTTIPAGTPIGFLLALTYGADVVIPGGDIWTKITKATGTSWTNIAKAT